MIIDHWNQLKKYPLGKWIFSRLLRRMVPYSGTIYPAVDVLEPGYCRVIMRDRRIVRNHLNSIHAVALMNLGELSSGLAATASLSPKIRAIVVRFSIEFIKKARGTLVAECHAKLPEVTGPIEHEVVVEVKDGTDTVVCRAKAVWLLDRR